MGFLSQLQNVIQQRITQPHELIKLVADRANARQLEACAPGTASPIFVIRQEDLIGLYTAGKQIYRELFVATTPDDVLRLLHPDNVLPARTFLRMMTYTEESPARVVVYGPEAGSSTVFGTVDGGAVEAFGYSTEAGSPGDEFETFLERQQGNNNETTAPC